MKIAWEENDICEGVRVIHATRDPITEGKIDHDETGWFILMVKTDTIIRGGDGSRSYIAELMNDIGNVPFEELKSVKICGTFAV